MGEGGLGSPNLLGIWLWPQRLGLELSLVLQELLLLLLLLLQEQLTSLRRGRGWNQRG